MTEKYDKELVSCAKLTWGQPYVFLQFKQSPKLEFFFFMEWLERDPKSLFYISKVGIVKEISGKTSHF